MYKKKNDILVVDDDVIWALACGFITAPSRSYLLFLEKFAKPFTCFDLYPDYG